jgi:hypothetical protein
MFSVVAVQNFTPLAIKKSVFLLYGKCNSQVQGIRTNVIANIPNYRWYEYIEILTSICVTRNMSWKGHLPQYMTFLHLFG